MKLEEEINQENLISYVEAYYHLNLIYKDKGISQLHHDFNNKNITAKQPLMNIISA